MKAVCQQGANKQKLFIFITIPIPYSTFLSIHVTCKHRMLTAVCTE